MSELPIPSLATLERLSGWAGEQAAVFVSVLQNPRRFYLEKVEPSPDPIPGALKFFAFIVLVCFVILVPINAILFNINVLDVKLAISATMPFLVAVALFSSLIFLFGKLVGGKGTFRLTLAGMLYFSAFLPFIYLVDYIALTDPDFRAAMLARNMEYFGKDMALVPRIGSWIGFAVIVFLAVRMLPLVKVIHRIGFVRAAIVIALTGSVYELYEFFVWMPFFAQLVKTAGGS
jgi:hypothetical protein